jgi:quercetin dioxygenase-like cupin family protein
MADPSRLPHCRDRSDQHLEPARDRLSLHPPGRHAQGGVTLIKENPDHEIMQLICRQSLGPLCGAVTLAAVLAASALHAGFGQKKTADAAGGASVTPVFAYDFPNLPGQKMTGVLVEYGPGGSSPPHHHTTKGSVVTYVLEGAIRSKVNDGPITVYEAGESWLEPPGAAHSVSENASGTEPARLLAVFVAEDGAELTTFDQ